ncbi:MAG TPA: diacylglycerol kinase family protein [Candidatus Saccharimonadales bacterium]|nr:diacylglycerol kinase family protein [Candidatus Saccharimonadales bacterium]
MRLSFLWRLLSALALASLAAGTVLLLKFTLSAPFLLVVAALTVLTLLYAGWLIFTGTHKRLRHGWALLLGCFVLLAVEIGLLLTRGGHQKLFLVAILLGALYLLLVRYLRRGYWEQRRRLSRATENTAHFRYPVLIINPESGNGRAIKAGVDTIAQRRGIRVIITKKEDNIEALARTAAQDGADVIGVSGGDGTLGAVAKVALECNLPLVILPGGTRCHFARDIGLDPKRIVDALEGFWGIARKVDVGIVGERVFLNNASFGVYADIIAHPEYRQHKLATTRKVLQELLDGTRSAYDLQFADGTGVWHAQAVQLFVGVNPYRTLRLFELGRRNLLDTGKLQVTVVTALDDTTIRRLIGTLTFRRSAGTALPANFLQWTAQAFTLHSAGDAVVAGVDGESEQYRTPLTISLISKGLTVMVPAEGVRGRPKSPLSLAMLQRLWRAVLGK